MAKIIGLSSGNMTLLSAGEAERIFGADVTTLGKGGGLPRVSGAAKRARITPAAVVQAITPSHSDAAYQTAVAAHAAATPPPAYSPGAVAPILTSLPLTPGDYTSGASKYRVSQLSDAQIEYLAESVERLATLTLARKMMSPMAISEAERQELIATAGVPRGYANLTDLVLSTDVETLGKGNVLKSVTKAVSTVAKKVVVPATKIMQAAAPLVAKIPVIGPIAAAGMNVTANAYQALAEGGLKKLTQGGVSGVLTHIVGGAGAAIGAAAAIGGAAAQGIIEAPGTIVSDLASAGQWVGQEAGSIASSIGGYLGGASGGDGIFSSIFQAGKSLVTSFDSSVISSIESINPSLSGELTSIFHGLGSEYQNFASVFDAWSGSMKGAPTNTSMIGKLNGNLYTILKDAAGHFTVKQTPATNAPVSTGSMPDGSLVTPQQMTGYGVPYAAAGSNAPSYFNGQGLGINPAGVSLPGGPTNATTDSTSQALLDQMVNQANAGKPAASPQLASMNPFVLGGLALAGLALIMKGGSLGPAQTYGPPRRASRGRR